jgi:hypothetical protein
MAMTSCRECPKCGARWLGGQLHWATGKPGKELDLAGLVCNTVNDPTCINPHKGIDGGETWAMRQAQCSLMGVAIEQKLQQPQQQGA